MSDVKHYGTTHEEDSAEHTVKCRQIVRTLIDFGVSEKEKLKIIFLLALELENRDHLQDITSLIERLEAGQQRSTLITEI